MEFSSVFVILPLVWFITSFVLFFLTKTRSAAFVSLFVIAISLIFVLVNFSKNQLSPYGLLRFFPFSAYGIAGTLTLSLVYFLYNFLQRKGEILETFSVLFSLLGSFVLLTSENLLMTFLGLEILSISLYLFLSGNAKEALKYLLYSGFATAISLFGLTLIFSENNTFSLQKISDEGLRTQTGTFLLAATFLFKAGIPPFHFWINDIYEKISPRKLAFFSSVPKLSVVMFLLKISSLKGISLLLFATGLGGLLVGTLLAFPEKNINKIFGFSSIVQVSYLFLSFLQKNTGVPLFFLSVYVWTILLTFLVNDIENIREEKFPGFSSVNKISYGIFLLQLIGLPVSAGFIAKIFLLESLWKTKEFWAFAGILTATLLSFAYYGRILLSVFKQKYSVKVTSKADYVLLILGLPLILFGVWNFDNIIKFLNFAS